jgi:hypothetical protein
MSSRLNHGPPANSSSSRYAPVHSRYVGYTFVPGDSRVFQGSFGNVNFGNDDGGYRFSNQGVQMIGNNISVSPPYTVDFRLQGNSEIERIRKEACTADTSSCNLGWW